jgi:death-on-curing protein
MVYLSTADVLDLFELHIGPRSALSRPELLESAVALPQATMFGEDLYPHIFQKAAALLRSIAQNQSFVDGNKRIAWLAMSVFLAANGIDVLATPEDGLQLMTDLANSFANIDAIGAFLAQRSRPRGDALGEISYCILAGIA